MNRISSPKDVVITMAIPHSCNGKHRVKKHTMRINHDLSAVLLQLIIFTTWTRTKEHRFHCFSFIMYTYKIKVGLCLLHVIRKFNRRIRYAKIGLLWIIHRSRVTVLGYQIYISQYYSRVDNLEMYLTQHCLSKNNETIQLLIHLPPPVSMLVLDLGISRAFDNLFKYGSNVWTNLLDVQQRNKLNE